VNDADFLSALESCRLAPCEFDHAAHVRAAYLYLRAADFAERNPELFEPDLLLRYYPKTQLDAPISRQVFVLPQPAAGGPDVR